ncbi:MAG: aldo/keto reductase [Chlamydiia bacterium]|nr:aldo/keto reductase [Chlamydiia bacterium]
MNYRNMGGTGLKLSECGLGTWLTFKEMDLSRNLVKLAWDAGVNFFDTAEVYGNGLAELILGEILRDFPRRECVVSTKLFWGGKKPNQAGLSRKHLLEGMDDSLRRLQMDYVDIVFCHRPDPMVSIFETVQAMEEIVASGKALYWGTSEWSAEEIVEAHELAERYAPMVEQPEYNLLHRDRVEKEYRPLYENYGMGTTIWSPLASGILTGKYNEGKPKGTRLEKEPELSSDLTDENLFRVRRLCQLARDQEVPPSALAIAWCLRNPNVSSVLLGASSEKQLKENLKCMLCKDEVSDKITELFQPQKEGV